MNVQKAQRIASAAVDVDFVAVDAALADNVVDHSSVPIVARDSSDHCFCVGRDYKKALLSIHSLT